MPSASSVHCYVIDASISTLNNQPLYLFFSNMAVEKICKKRYYYLLESQKLLHNMKSKRVYSERKIAEKLKLSKTAIHQAIVRFRKFESFQDLNRAGRS